MVGFRYKLIYNENGNESEKEYKYKIQKKAYQTAGKLESFLKGINGTLQESAYTEGENKVSYYRKEL